MSPRQQKRRKRPRIGDVIEIATPKGFAYAQFTHDHPIRGEVLRILPGLYATRPADLAALVQQRERYVTFYGLRSILMDNEVTVVGGREVLEVAIVGLFPVPARNRPFPLFRSPGGDIQDNGEFPFWTLWDGWDGETAQRVERLTESQRDLPLSGNPSHPLFIDRIVTGWSPRDWPEPVQEAEPEAAPSAASAAPPLRHFLHFPTEAAAERAATRLRADGYTDVVVEAPESAYFEEETPPGTQPLDRDWDVFASGDVPPPGEPFGDTRAHLEALAASLGGEYDGWELAVRD